LIAGDLGPPEFLIGLGLRGLERAAVPKTAVHENRQLELGKTKSGLPSSGQRRRQPVMPWVLKIPIRRSSVSLLPAPLMRDITSERLALVKMSLM
jgi:hypothetical protein